MIIKICSAHISTLLGAQGAETEKNMNTNNLQWYTSKNNIMCRDTCTMQLQMYIIFEKLWHKMSFKQRLKSDVINKLLCETIRVDVMHIIQKHTTITVRIWAVYNIFHQIIWYNVRLGILESHILL